jgi:hypothetical protein
MDKETKKKITTELENRKAVTPCPRCSGSKFTIMDNFGKTTLNQDLGGYVLGGPFVPFIVVICNNCGFMSQHAVGVLGVSNKSDEEGENG